MSKLRVVGDEERRSDVSLEDAVATGDVLLIMLAQRRLMASGLVAAGDTSKPQYNNELNKLNALIVAEEARRAGDGSGASRADVPRRSFDASAI